MHTIKLTITRMISSIERSVVCVYLITEFVKSHNSSKHSLTKYKAFV